MTDTVHQKPFFEEPFEPVSQEPFPPRRPSARPVAQDRWERLVSTVIVPLPLEQVWAGLTDREHLGRWLAPADPGWAVTGRTCVLDFQDGEFFWCLTDAVRPPQAGGTAELVHRWRWVGVGPSTQVTWSLAALGEATSVTVTELATNGPADWRSWNGMGWPGILDQLAEHLRTGRDVRWTWRRMGPYVQTELPASPFEAWAVLNQVPALQFWMGRRTGSLAVDDQMDFVLGDASGAASITVTEHLEAGQRFPSYLPSLRFRLSRGGWPGALEGHLWIEPTGLGGSLLQVFHDGWEMFGTTPTAPHDRTLLTQYWAGAFGRLEMLLGRAGGAQVAGPQERSAGPHAWSF